ncbi:MAG: RNA polymerase sigma factor [Actinomycetota bacterium]
MDIAIGEKDAAVGAGVDEGSFALFYEREFTAVVGLAYALSGSRSGAEDIAQEAFLAAHRSWDRVGAYEQPGAWVRRVTANLAVSTIRRRLSEARAMVRIGARRQEPLPELGVESEEFWRAVRALPKRQAQVAALRYMEDLSVADIARVLEMADGTVKAHLHAARTALARRLQLDIEEGS